ncbi:hypothetical protein N8I74_19145 [Chitiniphilus purpureus]|uniref:DUF1090 domain-containing protein n=1 Tax=Chitiniphilus purpureus TaxID=2981137 RepID=A0ABY6DM01_9NEIS|nr:hypothetical protein [Chitiniphilus sp. CD1]UXY15400.1 hypothetical protein N8I74_19145 [Chitiniphilus sp. CD1]
MNKPIRLHPILFAASLVFAAAGAAHAAADEHEAQRRTIQERYDTGKAQCKGLSGNAKDVCQERVKADRDIALAELDALGKNTPDARAEAIRVRAKAEYEVREEQCDDFAGNKKDVCMKEAKAARDKALAEADAGEDIDKANLRAADREQRAQAEAERKQREADYKVAKERCDDLAGDAKRVCLDDAERRLNNK